MVYIKDKKTTESKLLEIKPESVLLYSPKYRLLYLNGQQLSDVEAHSLQEEVKFVEKTRIWDIIQNTLKQRIIDIMSENAKALDTVFDDEKVGREMRLGKSMLHCLEIENSILGVIKQWKPKEVPKSPTPANPQINAKPEGM